MSTHIFKFVILLTVVITASSCSNNLKYFTKDLYQENRWTDSELERIQFYVSEDIVLQRQLRGENSRITDGKIRVVDGSKIEEIATSIESIFEGNVCLPSEILRTPSTRTRMTNDNGISPEQIRSLTRKELTVLKYLTQGLANKVIAYELNISETTVKSHVSSILKKLGASNRVKVVASAANIDFNQYVFN